MHRWRDRNQSEFFTPNITPKFKIKRDAKFFMLGSCFARGLEKELDERGFSVLSRPEKDMPFEMNRYTTPSMLQAIQGVPGNTEASYFQAGLNEWIDPYLQEPKIKRYDLADLRALRYRSDSINARIHDADVVVIVLGLTEGWADYDMGELYTNRYMGLRSGRFHLSILNAEENLEYLDRICEELGYMQIIITVSPVPLVATFTHDDVVIANQYSKSVLRAVAHEAVMHLGHDKIDYFPSYEMALYSKDPWKEDGRHVRNEVRAHIVEQFIKHYIEA